MRSLHVYGMMLVLAMPAFAHGQSAQSAQPATAAVSANAADPSVEYIALRDRLSARNKELAGEVANQRALVKHNEELLKEAEKLDASNKKMEAEKQKLSAQNTDLQKQRETLKSSMGSTENAELHMGGK